MQHVGKKLKCPKCGGAIKIPGEVPPPANDDAWLNLDEPAPPAAPTPSASTSANTSPRKTPGSAADSVTSTGQPKPDLDFNSFDPDNPFGSASLPTSPTSPAVANDDQWLDGLPPLGEMDFSSLQTGPFDLGPQSEQLPNGRLPAAGRAPMPDDANGKSDAKGKATPVATPAISDDYRAKCPTCESVHFVKLSQVGKTVRCSDCMTSFIAPPPPKVVEKKKFDMEKAPTFQLAEITAARDPFGATGTQAAAAMLRKAEDEVADEEDPHHEYENPDVRGWLKGIFGIFTDPAVGAYWLGLAILGAAPGVLSVLIGHPLLIRGSMLLSLVYLGLVLTCAFEILETVANGKKRVEEWPAFDPAEWLGQAFLAMAAAVLSASPGAIVSLPIFGPSALSFATILFSVFVFFPYVLLSMLDNGSITMPISGEVTKSVTRCKESWGILYFSSAFLFVFQFVVLVAFSSLAHPAATVFFSCFLSVGMIFIYFSMIGQLAFAIGQAINGGPADAPDE